MESNPQKKEETKKENKFEWADEGVSTLVRVIILGWSAAILTLNYVTVPGIPQKNIDPTFIASVFTGTLATFGVVPAKKKEDKEVKEDKKDAKTFSKAILHNANRLSEMVTSLIDLSRIEYGELKLVIKDIVLNDVVDSVLLAFKNKAKRKSKKK